MVLVSLVSPAQKHLFDGLTVMISACHLSLLPLPTKRFPSGNNETMRGRPGFDSPSESLFPQKARRVHGSDVFLNFSIPDGKGEENGLKASETTYG